MQSEIAPQSKQVRSYLAQRQAAKSLTRNYVIGDRRFFKLAIS
jgi:hypothetical protein